MKKHCPNSKIKESLKQQDIANGKSARKKAVRAKCLNKRKFQLCKLNEGKEGYSACTICGEIHNSLGMKIHMKVHAKPGTKDLPVTETAQ